MSDYTPTFEVVSGQGSQILGRGLSRAEAEKLARNFDKRCAVIGLTNPPTRIRQDGYKENNQVSDYTPTTEEVLHLYVCGVVSIGEIMNRLPGFEFDRWLAAHDAEVAKAAEERIIKLLDDQSVIAGYNFHGDLLLNRANLLALIKRENK